MIVFRSKTFEKSLKKLLKSKIVRINEIEKVVQMLIEGTKIPLKHKDHALQGIWKGYRECHIHPDILLIYQKQEKELILVLIDIGTHAKLFG